jgi:hypothetical protein
MGTAMEFHAKHNGVAAVEDLTKRWGERGEDKVVLVFISPQRIAQRGR